MQVFLLSVLICAVGQSFGQTITVMYGINNAVRNPCLQSGSKDDPIAYLQKEHFYQHKLGKVVQPYVVGEIDKELYEKGVITIRFVELDQNVIFTIQEAAVSSLEFTSGERTFSMLGDEVQVAARCFDLNIPVKKVVDALQLLPYESFTIKINFHGLHTITPGSEHRSFLYKGMVAPYSKVLDGGWMPLSLFSSNFKPVAEGGIPFSSQPIGGAWGKKLYLNSERKFLGISGVGNWLIYPTTDPNQPEDDSFSLSGGSLGMLLDVGSWFYVGTSYGFDFQGQENPKMLGVIGLGPKFFSLFKGE